MKKGVILILLLAGVFFITNIDYSSAQQNTVCCEQTTSGAYCQDVPATECAEGSRQLSTSCESTSFCKAGTCYDSSEGTCLDNTPQIVCNTNGGTWSEESPAQCNLGCCVLGDQASFVTLVRCKRLSSFLGLKTNYDMGITNELSCVQSVQGKEKGACVFESEFEKTCKFITRDECENSQESVNGTLITDGDFYEGKLCSAEELGTNCGPSEQTTCLAGKDEVYFVDTCGNPANIYDASKIKDKEYWANTKTKSESCNPDSGNPGSASCGNCNYLQGSFCRAESSTDSKANYGDFVCADLNCKDSTGNERLHGESWCVNDDKTPNDGANDVGSRFFREICINGEVVTEACSDFRNQECIEDKIETVQGDFSQAACRVNRWQDCLIQDEKDDCENSDRRDCVWKEGLSLGNATNEGSCVPANPPGLNFWEGQESSAICAQGNAQCVVKFEKRLLGGGEKCVENCECLTEEWEKQRSDLCSAIADCGPKVNWIGNEGNKKGFEIIKS